MNPDRRDSHRGYRDMECGRVDNPRDNANDEEGDYDEDEDSYGSEEGGSSGSEDDVENEGKKWMDVKDLRKMTLEEVKKMMGDDGSSANDGVPGRKIDQPITKVIVRRLPPGITIKRYLKELPEIPKYNYIRLVPQHKDFPSRIGKRMSIYINFEKEEEAFWFKEKYNNMTLFDEYGHDYISCVDFSLVQELAQDPVEDTQTGTLEESEVYTKFVEAYKEDPYAFTAIHMDKITPETMLEEIMNRNYKDNQDTPLLQFLKLQSEKEETEKVSREQRRRDRDMLRRKTREESAMLKQKEKDNEARKKFNEKDEAEARRRGDEKRDKPREERAQKERRRERDRNRQKDRDIERRLRREREKAAAAEKRYADPGTNGASGAGEEVRADRDNASQRGKDTSRRAENEKDAKTKSNPASVTYSKTGNVTRWSENSGPKRNDKRERGKDDQKKAVETKPGSSTALPIESKIQPSGSKNEDGVGGKSAFGKPFPMKEKDSTSAKSTGDRNKTDVHHKSNETLEKRTESSSTVASSEGGGSSKKKVVKKVIRVRKVSKEEGNNSNDQDNSESAKPRRIVRVVKKSSKPDESGSSKSSNPTPKGDDANREDARPKGVSEKERKDKKGRPEIQIYRPGSLRAGGSSNNASKSSTSKTGSSEKDKERSGDNNNP